MQHGSKGPHLQQCDFQNAGAITGAFVGSSQPHPNRMVFSKEKWPDGRILILGTDGALPLGGSLEAVRELLPQIL